MTTSSARTLRTATPWISSILVAILLLMGFAGALVAAPAVGGPRGFAAASGLEDATTCSSGSNATGIVSNVSDGPAPLAVAFCVATDGWNITSATWYFGDGSNATGLAVNHTFATPGAYPVHVLAIRPEFNGSFWEWIYARGTPVSIPVSVTASTAAEAGSPGALISVSALSCVGFCWINWSATNASYQTPTSGSGNGGANVYSFFAPLAPGNWTLTITVADPLGDTGSNATTVDVLADAFRVNYIGPTAPNGSAPFFVTFFVNYTGAIGNVSAAWTFGDGGNGTGLQVAHTYTQAGTYTAVATLTDGIGQVAVGNVSVVVTGSIGNLTNLVFTFQPDNGVWNGPAPFYLEAAGTISGGVAPYTVNVSWGNGQFNAIALVDSGEGFGLAYVYNDPGNYSVTATAVDSVGNQATVTFAVGVAGVAQLNASYQFVQTTGPGPVAVAALVNVVGGVPPYTIQYVWGDGTVSSAQNGGLAVHLYDSPGTYVPYANVSDAFGNLLHLDLGYVNVTSANGTSPAGHGVGLLPGGSSGWTMVTLAAAIGIGIGIATTAGIAYENRRRVVRREGEGIARALESEAVGGAPGGTAVSEQVKRE